MSFKLNAFVIPTGRIPTGHKAGFISALLSNPVMVSDKIPSPPATTIASGSSVSSSSMYRIACDSEDVLNISIEKPAR